MGALRHRQAVGAAVRCRTSCGMEDVWQKRVVPCGIRDGGGSIPMAPGLVFDSPLAIAVVPGLVSRIPCSFRSIRAADDPLWQSCALWHQGWCQPPWRGFIHFCSTRPLCDISCLLQDLPNAMNAAEITDKLGLHSLRHRNWYIQATCATSGDGLYEGLDWLANQLKNKK